MRGVRTTDIAFILVVAVLVVSTLLPALGRAYRSPAEVRCQSNLQRWAEAMELYLADNGGYFPTNRIGTGTHTLNPALALSPPDPLPGQTEPPRFYYGVNWVEALYDYLQDSARKTGQDWKTFRRCPNSGSTLWPPPNSTGYPFNAVTYAFNYNLVEYWRGVVRNPRKVMMLREIPFLTIAILRPLNRSVGQSSQIPQYAFNNTDSSATSEQNFSPEFWKPHGEGSYIVFADGHVHYFSLDYYPKYSETKASSCWDPVTSQWWNWAPGSGKSPEYVKTIAITP